MANVETFHPPSVTTRVFARVTRRPSRALALPLAGAAIGLGLALVNLIGPAVTVVPPGYVALVNQRPILMNDFISQTETIEHVPFAQTTAVQRRASLRGMIDEELLVQRALALDLPEQDTDVRKVLVDAVSAVVLARKTPTENELAAYFNAHRAEYSDGGQMRFQDIVLHVGGYQNADQTVGQAEADANEAVYQLRSGAALDYVMQHFGFVNSGNAKGGDELDFAVKLHLGDKLFAVASRLTDGEISDPVVESDGVHVVVMEQRVPPSPASFAASRNRVYTDFKQAEAARAEQENLTFLRSNAQIVLAPGQAE
jgi:hypothetical protein